MRTGPSTRSFFASVALAVVIGAACTGCVTGKRATEQLVDGVTAPEIGETDVPVVASGPPAPNAPASAAAHTGFPPAPQQVAGAQAPTQAASQGQVPADMGAAVMQGTGLKATSSSIFSTGSGVSPVAGGGSSPASLFHAAPAAQAPMSQAVPPLQRLPQETTDAGYQGTRSGKSPLLAATRTEASLLPTKTAEQADAAGPSLSLVGLFAATRKGRNKGTAAPVGKPDASGKTNATPGMTSHPGPQLGPQQAAVLSYAPLPGIRARSMFATVDDTAENHDDTSAAVRTASLSGLARLAPSGLLLQTETVETGCFKPQLLTILKAVERHYGKKVMVTSGRRSLSHNIKVGGAPLSRHLTCEAADIQVAGVSKWDVAGFLRQVDGRGGVGTYCHTESVHIDIGPRRDWNWQCAPRDA